VVCGCGGASMHGFRYCLLFAMESDCWCAAAAWLGDDKPVGQFTTVFLAAPQRPGRHSTV
jgi:hypothetical protein